MFNVNSAFILIQLQNFATGLFINAVMKYKLSVIKSGKFVNK
jgi:hypothetical protein